jgi:hypothetical protein
MGSGYRLLSGGTNRALRMRAAIIVMMKRHDEGQRQKGCEKDKPAQGSMQFRWNASFPIVSWLCWAMSRRIEHRGGPVGLSNKMGIDPRNPEPIHEGLKSLIQEGAGGPAVTVTFGSLGNEASVSHSQYVFQLPSKTQGTGGSFCCDLISTRSRWQLKSSMTFRSVRRSQSMTEYPLQRTHCYPVTVPGGLYAGLVRMYLFQ